MSEHISRKELKRDGVAETLAHGAEAVLSHQKMVWIIAGAAAVVLLAVFGWRFYSDRQTTKASAALEEALKVFHARVRAIGEREEPGEVTYVAEKNKYEDAVKKFTDVASNYSLTRPGRLARYYAGVSYERLGQYEQAQKWLREAESSGPEEVSALARFQLAGVLVRAGKGDEAVKLYDALMQKPSMFVPKPVVMLALGDYYVTRNPKEAVRLFNQMKQEFPDTSAAEEADKRLELLPKS